MKSRRSSNNMKAFVLNLFVVLSNDLEVFVPSQPVDDFLYARVCLRVLACVFESVCSYHMENKTGR